MSRLKDMYKNEIVDAMIKKFGYKISWKCRNSIRSL